MPWRRSGIAGMVMAVICGALVTRRGRFSRRAWRIRMISAALRHATEQNRFREPPGALSDRLNGWPQCSQAPVVFMAEM